MFIAKIEVKNILVTLVEVHRDKSHWIPFRSFEDDEDLLDPDRRAKFPEFRNLLFCLPEDQLCIRLVFNFFQYLGAQTLTDRVPGDLQSGNYFEIKGQIIVPFLTMFFLTQPKLVVLNLNLFI